jgi:hypothetical protein
MAASTWTGHQHPQMQLHKTCCVCDDVSDRDATEYELHTRFKLHFFKNKQNGRWTGEYICSRCYGRNLARERKKQDIKNMPAKIEECRHRYGIVLRIERGMPSCIRRGSEVVHYGIGCHGCTLTNTHD